MGSPLFPQEVDMNGFSNELEYVQIRKSVFPWRNQYRLTAPLMYTTKTNMAIVVPKGFVTNFATWLKPRGKYDEASVVHDHLYLIQAGKDYADAIFKEIMTRAGCSRLRINIMYYGVRWFGRRAYDKCGVKNGK